MKKRSRNFIQLILSLALLGVLMFGTSGQASAAGTIYVKASAGGLNNGTSWTNAYKSLKTALGAAVSGQQIWVAAGTYKPSTSDRMQSFDLVTGVAVYGGFAGTETLLTQRNPAVHVTVLSGEIGAAGIADNTYHVVQSSGNNSNTVLDGFTITAGNANSTFLDSDGGGILADSSGAKFSNLIFSGNAAVHGGGMYNNSSSVTLLAVTFTANKAGSGGGGGLYNYQNAATLVDVTFKGNTTTSKGGAVYNNGSGSVFKNVTFSGNTASVGGGAMYNAGAVPAVYNSIFWGDAPQEVFNSASSMTIADSIVAGGCPVGSGTCTRITTANPVLGPLQYNGGFTKTMALGAGSAAIDLGNNATCALTDQRGVSRPQGARCDIGAYEVKVLSFSSAGAYDGWLLESIKGSGVGGSLDSTLGTLRVGDDASNRQYRGLLSFNTAGLPDGATVVLGKVRVMRSGIAGTNPFSTHGSLLLDLAKPYFGAQLGMVVSDFQAAATVSPAGTIGSTLVSGGYTGLLNSAGRAAVNKTGTTQLRLRFSLATNNDSGADYLALYSGDATTTSYWPRLIVYYNP